MTTAPIRRTRRRAVDGVAAAGGAVAGSDGADGADGADRVFGPAEALMIVSPLPGSAALSGWNDTRVLR